MKFFVKARGEADLLIQLGEMLGWQPSEWDEADVVLTDHIDEVGSAVAAGKQALFVSNLAAGVAEGRLCNRVVTFGSGCFYGVLPK
jgi:hypothetical protein